MPVILRKIKIGLLDFQDDIVQSIEIMRTGGLILYPTDTIWGIGCDATNAEAVQRIYSIKKRPESKSMIVLLAHERDILKYTSQTDLQIFSFLKTVQKPTTVIYEGAVGLATNLLPTDGTIAIRLVKEDFCRHLIKRFRKPVVSTSANISGNPSPRYFEEIDESIKEKMDYVVKWRQEEKTIHEPSAIVKWGKSGVAEFIRK
ncbi:MAG: threonylcarbamoyl-AMP synthase [Bacteroidetes bacterium]|nr:threonylcarbamoyl-AMP synthase [Bacteroidota bacterium]